MTSESDPQRRKRETQRALFDGVATLYDATRQGYPDEIMTTVLKTADLNPGSSVIELGCGTGQLTRQLAGRGLHITAIDIAPAMLAAARSNVSDPLVSFRLASFENFEHDHSVDLVVSGTAFHWVDPQIRLVKAAGLLSPAGWLALLWTGEKYDEPLRASLRQLWTKYNSDTTEWSPRLPWAEVLQEAPMFGEVRESTHEHRISLPAETVVGVECTRATYLSFDEAGRRGFKADLEELHAATQVVELTQETDLFMASVSLPPVVT